MKKIETETTTTNTREDITAIYAPHEHNVSNVLLNLEATQPAPLIYQLKGEYYRDIIARANPATFEDYTDRAREHRDTLSDKAEQTKRSKRLTLSDADRADAYALALEYEAQADNERGELADLDKLTARTLSQRADLVQVSAEAECLYHTNGIGLEPNKRKLVLRGGKWVWTYTKSARDSAQKFRAYYNALDTVRRIAEQERAEGIEAHHTKTEVYAIACKRYCRNAVKAYIRAQKGICALDTIRTALTPATADDVKAWTRAGKLVGSEYRYPTKDGTNALEWRDQTTERKAGFYFVHRRPTYKTAQSFEALTAEGIPAGIEQTRLVLVDSFEAKNRVNELIESGAGTKRDGEFLRAFCTAEAIQAENTARNEYIKQNTTATANGYTYKGTEEGISAAGYNARRKYAYKRVGLDPLNASACSKFFGRLCERFGIDENNKPTPKAKTERDPYTLNDWRYMAESNRGNAQNAPAEVLDLIAWTKTTAPDFAPAIKWQTHTKATKRREAEERARARVWELPLFDGHSRIDNATAEAEQTAEANATRYKLAQISADRAHIVTLTADEVRDIWSRYTKHRAKEERKAPARAKAEAKREERKTHAIRNEATETAKRLGVAIHNPPAKLWNTWSGAQKLANVYFEIYNK